MIQLFACAAWSLSLDLPFNLPEFTWWVWVLIGVATAIFAAAVGKFSDQYRFAGFLSVVIAVLAALCGAVAIYELLVS
jgi:hypothetical protein